jgi:hypothetical protein
MGTIACHVSPCDAVESKCNDKNRESSEAKEDNKSIPQHDIDAWLHEHEPCYRLELHLIVYILFMREQTRQRVEYSSISLGGEMVGRYDHKNEQFHVELLSMVSICIRHQETLWYAILLCWHETF